VQVLLCALCFPEGGQYLVAVKQVQMAAEYRGQNPSECKGFIKSDLADASDVGFLDEELEIHKHMCSDHIVHCLGYITSATDPNQRMGMLMQAFPLSGTSLAAAINNSRTAQLGFIQQALLGSIHVHSKGYLHLDVKLPNFLWHDTNGNSDVVTELTDFVLALKVDEDLSQRRGTITHTLLPVTSVMLNFEFGTPVPASVCIYIYA
jgi:serine/threonine protein kinase